MARFTVAGRRRRKRTGRGATWLRNAAGHNPQARALGSAARISVPLSAVVRTCCAHNAMQLRGPAGLPAHGRGAWRIARSPPRRLGRGLPMLQAVVRREP